jgi:hypothetical protein
VLNNDENGAAAPVATCQECPQVWVEEATGRSGRARAGVESGRKGKKMVKWMGRCTQQVRWVEADRWSHEN